MKRPAHRAGRFVCFTNVSIRCPLLSGGEVFLMNSRSADSLDGRYFGGAANSHDHRKGRLFGLVGRNDLAAQKQGLRPCGLADQTLGLGAASHDDRSHSDPPVR